MKSVRLSHYLYTASLFFLIFLTAVCVALSAADVIIQALTDNSNSGQLDYRNLIVVGGSYVLLVRIKNIFKPGSSTHVYLSIGACRYPDLM